MLELTLTILLALTIWFTIKATKAYLKENRYNQKIK